MIDDVDSGAKQPGLIAQTLTYCCVNLGQLLNLPVLNFPLRLWQWAFVIIKHMNARKKNVQRTENTKYSKEFVLLIRHLSHNVTHSKINTYVFFSPESCLLFLSKNMIQLPYRTFALFTKSRYY